MQQSVKSTVPAKICLIAGLILAVEMHSAHAQFGPILPAAGPVNQSMGGASTAAPLTASGAMYWNPATLSGLDGPQIDIGANLLVPHTSVTSKVPAGTFGPGFPPVDMSGTTQNEDAVFAIPNMAASYRPDGSPFTYGVGIFGSAGFGLNYRGSNSNPVLTAPAPNGLGFGPVFSQFQVVQITPSVVYDVNDQLSVSFSPLVDIGSAQLDPGVFAAPDDADGNGFPTYPPGMHSSTAWGAGFVVGTYYKAGDWGFGSSYKSPQWFQSYQFNTVNELGMPRTAELSLNLPAIISVGTSYKGIDRVLLAADVRYFDFDNTAGFGDSGFAPSGALQGLDFQSIFAVAIGAQYQLTEDVSLRSGYTFSDNPVPSSQTAVNLATPLTLQHSVSAGASYDVTDAFSLSLAYTHCFQNSISGPLQLPTGPVPGTSIQSSTSADMIMVGATVKFGGCKRRESYGSSEYR